MGFGPGSRNFMSEEEKKNLPQVTPELLKRVFSYLTPYWKQLALTLLCIVFSSIMSLMPSVLTGKIIDEGLIGRDFNKLIMYIVLSLAVTAHFRYAQSDVQPSAEHVPALLYVQQPGRYHHAHDQ